MKFLLHFSIAILLTILALFLHTEIGYFFHFLIKMYHLFIHFFQSLFSTIPYGYWLANVLALILPPAVLTLIISLIKRVLLKKRFVHNYSSFWFTWILLITLLIR